MFFYNIFNSYKRKNKKRAKGKIGTKRGGASIVKRTRKRGCTKTNPIPPCERGFYEKASKKGDICCYKQKVDKTKKNNLLFYFGAY